MSTANIANGRYVRRLRVVSQHVRVGRDEVDGDRPLSRKELARMERLRPRTRAQCEAGPRPCPWVSCRYHLFLDVSEDTGSIKLATEELAELSDTCALDVAERGPRTLSEAGEAMRVTRERVRQIEEEALARLRRKRTRIMRDDDAGE